MTLRIVIQKKASVQTYYGRHTRHGMVRQQFLHTLSFSMRRGGLMSCPTLNSARRFLDGRYLDPTSPIPERTFRQVGYRRSGLLQSGLWWRPSMVVYLLSLTNAGLAAVGLGFAERNGGTRELHLAASCSYTVCLRNYRPSGNGHSFRVDTDAYFNTFNGESVSAGWLRRPMGSCEYDWSSGRGE